ncbi:MAG: hypothetical protein AB9888_15375 [Bacteroidales bacterium]
MQEEEKKFSELCLSRAKGLSLKITTLSSSQLNGLKDLVTSNEIESHPDPDGHLANSKAKDQLKNNDIEFLEKLIKKISDRNTKRWKIGHLLERIESDIEVLKSKAKEAVQEAEIVLENALGSSVSGKLPTTENRIAQFHRRLIQIYLLAAVEYACMQQKNGGN